MLTWHRSQLHPVSSCKRHCSDVDRSYLITASYILYTIYSAHINRAIGQKKTTGSCNDEFQCDLSIFNELSSVYFETFIQITCDIIYIYSIFSIYIACYFVSLNGLQINYGFIINYSYRDNVCFRSSLSHYVTDTAPRASLMRNKHFERSIKNKKKKQKLSASLSQENWNWNRNWIMFTEQ